MFKDSFSTLIKSNSKKGFTLVEILVAVGILGILFGVVISSNAAIQKTSRDTQRKGDLMKIKSALQQYYADKSTYPADITFGNKLEDGSKVYLNNIPEDPLNSGGYAYGYKDYRNATTVDCDPVDDAADTTDDSPSVRCHYYYLYAIMENTGGAVDCTQCGGAAGDKKYYVVTPN